MPVNPNEAPEGFVAVEQDGCDGCYFQRGKSCTIPLNYPSCTEYTRDDGVSVVFILLTDKPATANFPHDDMGTPV